MSEVLAWELEFVLFSFCLGLLIRMGYDFLLILRLLLEHSVFWVSLEDILFCIAAGLGVFAFFYRMNDGVWRGFSLLAIGVGMWIWHWLISKNVQKILPKFVKKIAGVLTKIHKKILPNKRR